MANSIKKLFTLLAFAVFGILICACGQQSAPEANAGSKYRKNSNPDFFLYAVNVDELRVRKQPDLSSEIITKLSEGTIVSGDGQASENQAEVQLRGALQKAPFYQVHIGSESLTGWVYGGALTNLYSGKDAEKPDTNKIAALSAFLAELDVLELQSGGKAWEHVEAQFDGATGPLADASFYLLEQFLRQISTAGNLQELANRNQFSQADIQAIFNNKFDPQKFSTTASLAANGFRLATADGRIKPEPDWRRLQDFFSPRVTHPLQVYLNQRTAEQNVTLMRDGGSIISMRPFPELAVFWEKFNGKYPHFCRNAETAETERWYRQLLLCGTDNTPPFNPNTQKVEKEFKLTWNYAADAYPNTKTGQLAKQLLQLCESEGWKRTEKVNIFLSLAEQQ